MNSRLNESSDSDIPEEVKEAMLDKIEVGADNPDETVPSLDKKKSILQKVNSFLNTITIGKKELGIHYMNGEDSFAIPLDKVLTLCAYTFLLMSIGYLVT